MALRPILIVPDPVLRLPAEPVPAVDDDVRRLVADMFETMYKAPGIGLAAPQVGVLKRVVVVDVADGEERRPMALINPAVTWRSEEKLTAEEGCLSLPQQFAEVTRPAAIKVGYRNIEDQPVELEANGLLARCIQHELDHLDGVLFVDHISALRRGMILRKLAKARRARD